MPVKLVPDSDLGAGIQDLQAGASGCASWIPAGAGMTYLGYPAKLSGPTTRSQRKRSPHRTYHSVSSDVGVGRQMREWVRGLLGAILRPLLFPLFLVSTSDRTKISVSVRV